MVWKEYVKRHPSSSLYNALMMNSFDWVSGFVNPKINLQTVGNIVEADGMAQPSQEGQDMLDIVGNHKAKFLEVLTNIVTDNSPGKDPKDHSRWHR